MHTHTTNQQQTITNTSFEVINEIDHKTSRKKARQLTTDDMVKIGELRFLDIHQVTAKINSGKSTLYDWLDEKSPRYDSSFPKPIKINEKSIAWIANEIEEWMLLKIKLSRGEDYTILTEKNKLS